LFTRRVEQAELRAGQFVEQLLRMAAARAHLVRTDLGHPRIGRRGNLARIRLELGETE
jgi:hypothetical protein